MKHGSLPRSITLPTSAIAPDHAPDGLTERDVDALAAEAGIDLDLPTDDQPIGPVIPLHVENAAVPWDDEAA